MNVVWWWVWDLRWFPLDLVVLFVVWFDLCVIGLVFGLLWRSLGVCMGLVFLGFWLFAMFVVCLLMFECDFVFIACF